MYVEVDSVLKRCEESERLVYRKCRQKIRLGLHCSHEVERPWRNGIAAPPCVPNANGTTNEMWRRSTRGRDLGGDQIPWCPGWSPNEWAAQMNMIIPRCLAAANDESIYENNDNNEEQSIAHSSRCGISGDSSDPASKGYSVRDSHVPCVCDSHGTCESRTHAVVGRPYDYSSLSVADTCCCRSRTHAVGHMIIPRCLAAANDESVYEKSRPVLQQQDNEE